VTSVATGRGLTGGPITNTGTISFTGPWFFVADYANIQAAFNAVCAVNGSLVLPPGQTALPAGGLVLPSGFTGGVQVLGCGKRVSVLTQANASPGISFVPNTGQPGNTWFLLQGFSVAANNASCTVGVSIDYGTGATSEGNPFGGSVVDVDVYDGSGHWLNQFYYFRNCWSYANRGLSSVGTYSASGGGTILSGNGIVIDSCVNMSFTDTNILNCAIGVYQPSGSGSVGASQGTRFVGINILQCTTCLNAYLGVNQGIWVTNFIFDDGNNALAGMLPVYLVGPNPPGGGNGAGGASFTNGQVLQYGGTYAFELTSVSRVMVQNVDFTYCNNTTAAILLANGTINCSIQACTGPLSGSPLMILANTGTSGSKSFNNIGWSATDNGTNTLTS